MAATFRTPTGRRPGTGADTMNLGSPSMIPRVQHGTPGTPTGTSSEVGTTMSGTTTDSRKRQSKKDEVPPCKRTIIDNRQSVEN
jgi:hypothetical protein